ncbi:glycosyltransferase [Nonomuraea sp. B19D2]|uniref:glycosyltransferase n=1 Tax=Nonomuraea sp. B19D2 TaxID=3159561 RepID=UPI0032DAEDFD
MKVLILTHGTRGDVQPYAALALVLKRAGHEPVLGAPAAMASLAEPYGILRHPDGRPATVLQAFSGHVLPDGLDYPHLVHTTGFWFLPAIRLAGVRAVLVSGWGGMRATERLIHHDPLRPSTLVLPVLEA